MITGPDHLLRRLLKIKRELLYTGADVARAAAGTRLLMRILGYQVHEPQRRIIAHQEITANLNRRDADLTLAFRGVGKSTGGTITRGIKYLLPNPNIRILIGSDTEDAAAAFHGPITQHLQTNALLITLFGRFLDPAARGDLGRVSDSRSTIFQRTNVTLPEPTFTCLGIGGQAASRHFDVALLDDLVTMQRSRTSAQRSLLSAWHASTLIGCLQPRAKVHYLGTRYYPQDLWDELEFGRPDEGGNGPLRNATLRIPMVTGPGGAPWDPALPREQWEPTYPERFPIEVCLDRRRRMGAYHFAAQMQQDCALGEGQIFMPPDFRWWSHHENQPPDDAAVWQYSDLAAKKTETGDYFATVTIKVGTDKDGGRSIWVLDLIRERLGTGAQKASIIESVKLWRPIQHGVEAVAMQAGFAEEVRDSSGLPVEPCEVEKDKVFRARRVSPMVEAHRVYFPVPEIAAGKRCEPLVSELSTFPDGDHDDTVDAFVGAITLAMFGGPAAVSLSSEDARDTDEWSEANDRLLEVPSDSEALHLLLDRLYPQRES